MMADLLHEDLGAIVQCCLPRLTKDGVERFPPGLKCMLQAGNKPVAQCSFSRSKHSSMKYKSTAGQVTLPLAAGMKVAFTMSQ